MFCSLCAFSSVVLERWNALFAPRANGAARRRSRWVKRFPSGVALVGAAWHALLIQLLVFLAVVSGRWNALFAPRATVPCGGAPVG